MIDYLILIAAYFLGSIPFGLLLSKAFGLGDIRAIGSGNIGATNVLRSGNKLAAGLTLLLDAFKGAAAVALALTLAPALAPWAGIAAVLGHNFPIWLKFKGGKGVATSLGVLLALHWLVGLCIAGTWLLLFAITRTSSLAALAAAASAPLWAWWLGTEQLALVALLLSTLLIARHHSNIRRLLQGNESKSA